MAMVHLSRTELSTHEAVENILGKPQVQYTDYSGYIYFYGGTVIEEDNFWDIHNSLMGKIAMRHKYDTDLSKYENQHIGLPYNIPFVFKLKNLTYSPHQGEEYAFWSRRLQRPV